MGNVPAPTIIWTPAHGNNYARGRAGGRNGQYTNHHVVGSADSALSAFQNPSRQASSTFIVTDVPGVIYQPVSLDDTSYADGNGASNSRAITTEHHGDWRFGYRNNTVIDNAVHLVAWLRDNGYIDHQVRHREVSLLGTQCCADLPIDEIWNRATALIAYYNGGAVPAEGTPAPAVGGAKIAYTKYPAPKKFRTIRETTLWRFDQTTWGAFGGGVSKLPEGTEVVIHGEGYNADLDATYLMTEYSFERQTPNGFNHKDLQEVQTSAELDWTKLPVPVELVVPDGKEANLWDFNRRAYAEVPSVKVLKAGERVTAYATCHNKQLNATYWVTEYSYSKQSSLGFNVVDLVPYVAPAPPATPEWVRNLKPAPEQKLIVLVEQTPIVHLETGDTIKQLGAGTVVDVVAKTTVGGKEYWLSAYSVKNSMPNGISTADIGVPVTPPASEKPGWLERWEDIADVDMYARADTDLVNLEGGATIKVIRRGEKVRISSTTEWFGHKYAMTEYSTDRREGRGIRLDDLDMKPITEPPVSTPDSGPKPAPSQSWVEQALGALLDKFGIARP